MNKLIQKFKDWQWGSGKQITIGVVLFAAIIAGVSFAPDPFRVPVGIGAAILVIGFFAYKLFSDRNPNA